MRPVSPNEHGSVALPKKKKFIPFGNMHFENPDLQKEYLKMFGEAATKASNKSQKKAIGLRALTAGSKGSSEQKTAESITKLANTNARIKALGGTPVGQQKKTSLWNKTLDVLSRGDYASAETANAIAHGDNPIKGFWEGLSGKKKTTYGQLVHKAGLSDAVANMIPGSVSVGAHPGSSGKPTGWRKTVGNIVEGAVGLTADVGLDPTTYMGVGLVPKAGKVADISTKSAEHLSQGEKILARNKLPTKQLSEHERAVLTGQRKLKGQVVESEEAHVYKPLREMRAGIVNTRKAEIADEMRSSAEYADKIKTAEGRLQHTTNPAEIESYAHEMGNQSWKGGPTLYHGTSARFAEDTPTEYSGNVADNLFGQGLYTTDVESVGRSYMRKGKVNNPALYKVKWTGKTAPKILDLDKSRTPAVQTWVHDIVNDTHGGIDGHLEIADKINGMLAKGTSDSKLILETRKYLYSAEMSKSETDEIVSTLTHNLREDGWDILSHRGGIYAKPGSTAHKAHIFLDPSKTSLVDATKRGTFTGIPGKTTATASSTKAAKAASANAERELNKQAGEAAQKEADQWMNTAVKHYQDMAANKIQKGIGVGLSGLKGKKITVIPAPVLAHTVNKIPQIDVVSRSLKTFDHYFRNAAGVSPLLHGARLEATAAGSARAEILVNRLRDISVQLPKEDRVSSWNNAIDRNVYSGHSVKLHDGTEIDPSELFNTEIDRLDHNIHGTMSGDTPFSAAELNARLSPSHEGKFAVDKNGSIDIRKTFKDWKVKDGPAALWQAQQAYERAVTHRAWQLSAADSLGMQTKGAGALVGATKIHDGLRSRGWSEVTSAKTHGVLDGVLFDPETKAGIEKILGITQNEREWGKFWRGLGRINAQFKFIATQPNPGYHVRNSIGDYMVNEFDGVSHNSYRQAGSLQMHQAAKYGGISPLVMAEGNMLEAAGKLDSKVLFHTKRSHLKPGGRRGTGVTEAEIAAGVYKHGVTQTYARTEFGSNSLNPGMLLGSKAKAKIIEASEARENLFRISHFIEMVKRNPKGFTNLDENMAWAAKRVRDRHFDYSDFTNFEKKVMSNIIPFYKWQKKALPLMLELMFTDPGKVVVPTKAQHALSQMMGQDPTADNPFPNVQGLLPKWALDMGYSPGAMLGGKNTIFGISSPFTDMFNQTIQPLQQGVASGPLGTFNSIAQQVTPALKDPFELVMNKNTFMSGGNVSDQVPVYKEGSVKKDLKQYAVNQIPYGRQISRAKGDPDKSNLGGLISQLTGIYAQQVTPSMQRGEAYRQQMEASKKYKVLKKKITKVMEGRGLNPPVTNSEWEKFLEANSNYKRPIRKSR